MEPKAGSSVIKSLNGSNNNANKLRCIESMVNLEWKALQSGLEAIESYLLLAIT